MATEVDDFDGRTIGDDDARAVADLAVALWAEAVPDQPSWPADEVIDDLRDERPHVEIHVFTARDGDDVAGAAVVDLRSTGDNPTMAWMSHVFVRPEARGQRIGRALLDATASWCRGRGRTFLLAGAVEGHPGAEGLARSVGARRGLVEHQNRLDTATLDPALLADWAATSPPGYSIVAWDDRCPEELVEPYVDVLRSMNDAPMDEGLEDFRFTVGQVRATEAEHARRGDSSWTVAARHDATGELAGMTQIGFPRHRTWGAEQGDTCVAPAHRGHGIGRWMKAINLIRLLDERPSVRFVDTWNAGANQHMLAINHALGFRLIAPWQEWAIGSP